MQEARDGGGRGEVREQQQPRQADRHAHSVRPQLLRRGQDPHELQGDTIIISIILMLLLIHNITLTTMMII